jgi:hypothetical protein
MKQPQQCSTVSPFYLLVQVMPLLSLLLQQPLPLCFRLQEKCPYRQVQRQG